MNHSRVTIFIASPGAGSVAARGGGRSHRAASRLAARRGTPPEGHHRRGRLHLHWLELEFALRHRRRRGLCECASQKGVTRRLQRLWFNRTHLGL